MIKGGLKACGQDVAATLAAHRAAALADLLQYLRDFTLTFADQRRHPATPIFATCSRGLATCFRTMPTCVAAPRRGSVVFVDEFQDTDPLQVEIAWFLASERPRR